MNSPIFKCSWTKSCTRWYWKYLGIKVWKHSSSQVSLPGWVVHQQYHSVPQRLLGASGHQGNSLKCSDIQPRRKTESEENLPKICIYIYNYNWHKYLLLYIYYIYIFISLFIYFSMYNWRISSPNLCYLWDVYPTWPLKPPGTLVLVASVGRCEGGTSRGFLGPVGLDVSGKVSEWLVNGL